MNIWFKKTKNKNLSYHTTNEHLFSPPGDWNQHHGFLSSTPLLALFVSCCPSLQSCYFTSVIFGSQLRRVASIILFSPASWWVFSSHGRLPSSMGRSQFGVIIDVVAMVALLPSIALSPGTIGRYSRLFNKSWSCHSSPSLTLLGLSTLVSCVSFLSLGYSYLHSPWRQPGATPLPRSAPPHCGASVARRCIALSR